LIRDEQQRQRANSAAAQQQPEAQQMDIASFIATVTDPRLRLEIMAGLDEATIATLPPNLYAEAQRMNDQIREERNRARNLLEQMD